MTDTVIEALHRKAPAAPAIIDDAGETLSYEQLLAGAERIGGQLAALGVSPGTTAATVLPNGPAAAQVYLGTLTTGRSAPLNPKLTARELVAQLEGVAARVLVTTPDRVTELAALPIDLPVVSVEPAAAGFELHNARGPVGDHPREAVRRSDGALVLMTSGTTGAPKRVSLTHANLLHAVESIVATLRLEEADTGLLLMPQFHIHGLQAGLLSPLIAGGRVVIPPGFDVFSVARLCRTNAVTWYTAVPSMHGLIADRAVGRDRDWAATIRFTRSSSAAMPAAIQNAVEAIVEAPLLEAYGMTECAHQIASNALPPAERLLGSVGEATGVDIRIADERDNGRGEVLVRGPSVTRAYEAVDPEVNARSFSEGWFRTGDEGIIDGTGRLTLTGRLKEIINRGGEKIRPQEVEDVIARLPGVKEVAVFAVPHRRLGEEVAAVVVPTAEPPEPQAIRLHAREELAAFKVPSRVILAEAIPRGPTGKVQRSKLADQLDLT